MKQLNIESGDLLKIKYRKDGKSYTYLLAVEKNEVGQPMIIAQQIDSPSNILEIIFFKPAISINPNPNEKTNINPLHDPPN